MTSFRALLLAMTACLFLYTGYVGIEYGFNIFPMFIGEIMAGTWQGQFNLDFNCYLVLSGLWVAWRDRFSAGGILFGLVAAVLGMVLFAPYLLWLTFKHDGDMRKLLLGANA
ncbi:MAG: hypothetical protein AB1Z98_22905 [Nannocystaceae bacterium]